MRRTGAGGSPTFVCARCTLPLCASTFIITALEELPSFFLSAKWRHQTDGAPLHYDLVWPSHSAVLLIAQFLSTGLTTEGPTSTPTAAWGNVTSSMVPASSFEALARDYPKGAMNLRQGIAAAASSLEVRQSTAG